MPGATGAEGWQLRVCAPPDDLPASHQSQEGFDNRIAQLLAEDLRAELDFVWVPVGLQTIRDYLRAGVCDVVMGVPDGYLGLLSTNAYYQIPHAFVSLEPRDVQITSLEDEALKELRIGTYPLGLADLALRNLGIRPFLFRPTSILNQLGAADPLLKALRDGSIDVAVLSGSVAGQYLRAYPGEFRVVPVSPAIAPPFVPMVQIGTIGLRPGDVSLRDELNLAMARRWDEIVSIFEEYRIALLPLPRPLLPAPGVDQEELRIGVVIPTPSGRPAPTDAIGLAAQNGAVLAEHLLVGEASARGVALRLLLASAPTPEAALRAAERLVVVEGVSALIGGFSNAEAAQLARLAADRNVLFMNVAASGDDLRATCQPYAFHIEASESAYLSAVAAWFADQEVERWFFVYPDSDDGRSRYRRAVQAVSAVGGMEAGGAEVPVGQQIYTELVGTIQRARPDLVFSLLDAPDQDFLLAQLGNLGERPTFVHFPHPVTQTRSYWLRMIQASPSAEQTYRVVLWEPTLEDRAAELNDQFGSRFGAAMDSSAWAVYAAAKVLLDATLATGSTVPELLARYLADPQNTFDISKGVALSFGPWDHQLRQPLYMVQANLEAPPGVRLPEQLARARLIGEVPLTESPGTVPRASGPGDSASARACVP